MDSNILSPSKKEIKNSCLLLLALLYLLIPNILFVWGWVRAEYALPLILGLCVTVLFVWQRTVKSHPFAGGGIPLTGRNLIQIALIALVALGFTELMGLHGHSYQHCDFFVRNPIYDKLVNSPWPLFSVTGDYFVYYHAFWLPPALLSSYVSDFISPMTVLFVWCYMGIFLFLLMAYARLGSKTFIFIAILFLFESFSFMYDVKDMQKNFGTEWLFRDCCNYRVCLNFVFNQLCNTYNHAIPSAVCLMLLFGRMIPVKYYPVPAALICSMSPMVALALVPFFSMVYLNAIRRRKDWPLHLPTLCCACLVFIVGAYMSAQGSAGGASKIAWMWGEMPPVQLPNPDFEHASFRIVLTLIVFTTTLLPLYFLTLPKMRKTIAFASVCLTLTLICFLWVGRTNNELLFKGSLCILIPQALIWARQWSYLSWVRRACFILVVFLAYLPSERVLFHNVVRTYSWDKEQMQKNINWGPVFEPKCWMYPNFFCKSEVPFFLKAEEK